MAKYIYKIHLDNQLEPLKISADDHILPTGSTPQYRLTIDGETVAAYEQKNLIGWSRQENKRGL